LQFSNLQPFLCENGGVASLTIDMTSMLFLITNSKKQPQKTIHFEVDIFVATPLWPSVGVKPNTSKVGDLESFGTPECLKLDSKAQNTLH
jgi:hypothetical protein